MTVGSLPAPARRTWGTASAVVSSTAVMHSPGTSRAGTDGASTLLSGPLCCHQRAISITSAHNDVPSRAIAKDSSGTPPNWTSDRNGPLVWPKPTTPQGNPPNGTLDFSHSCIAHSSASHSGQPGSRRTTTANIPNTATNNACNAASISHGTGPTSPLIHGSSGM